MSRSSTEGRIVTRRSGVSGGLEIGRGVVRYVEIESKAGRSRVRAASSARLATPLFETEPTRESAEAMADALARVAEDAKNRYLPIHVSVPDPLVRTTILELDALPKSEAARTALARHRLQRDLPALECEYRTQVLGALPNGKHLMLAVAMSGAWHRMLVDGLRAGGVTAWSLAGRLTRLLNAVATGLAGASGVLVSVLGDSWALAVLDAQGRPRYARSQWRADGMSMADIAAEVQRAVLAYVHQDASRSVEKIWLFAQEGEDELADELSARAGGAPERLTPAALAVEPTDGCELSEYIAAVAAALQ